MIGVCRRSYTGAACSSRGSTSATTSICSARLPDESFTLVYVDPPFNTGREQRRLTPRDEPRRGRRPHGLRRPPLPDRDDRQPQLRRPVRRLPAAFLEPRLREARRLLAADGTLYLHLDYREAHYCKVLLDDLFGRAMLPERDHLGLRLRRRARSAAGRRSTTRSSSTSRIRRAYYFDSRGRRPRAVHGARASSTPEKAARGKLPTDVWWHTIVSPTGREKTGYPTQKPLGVLRRIVQASSRRGRLVPRLLRRQRHARRGRARARAASGALRPSNPEAVEVMRARLGLPVLGRRPALQSRAWHGLNLADAARRRPRRREPRAVGADDQPAVRARPEDDRLRPHLGRAPRARTCGTPTATRFLDLLGGFGMFNVGRNNPRVRAGADRGARARPARLGAARRVAAAAAPRRGAAAPHARRGSSACSSRAPAPRPSRRRSSSAAPRRGRARVVSAEHGFHGLDARLALGERERRVRRAASGRSCPGSPQVPFGDLDALELELRREDVARLPRRAGAGQGRPPAARRATSRARRSSAAATGRSSASTRCRPASAAPASCSRSSTGASSPTSSRSRSRSRAATCRSARSLMSTRGARARVRLDGERVQPRLDVRAERARDGGRARDAARARRAGPRRALGARSGARLLELTRAARRAPRRRARRARARADVGDRVRRAAGGTPLLPAASSGSSTGLFAQLVVVPLFRDHRILSQVAGHGLPVIKGLPPLTVGEERPAWTSPTRSTRRSPGRSGCRARSPASRSPPPASANGPRPARGHPLDCIVANAAYLRFGAAILAVAAGAVGVVVAVDAAPLGARADRRVREQQRRRCGPAATPPATAIEGGRIPTPGEPRLSRRRRRAPSSSAARPDRVRSALGDRPRLAPVAARASPSSTARAPAREASTCRRPHRRCRRRWSSRRAAAGCYQAKLALPRRTAVARRVSLDGAPYRFALPALAPGAARRHRASSTRAATTSGGRLKTLVWHERLAGEPDRRAPHRLPGGCARPLELHDRRRLLGGHHRRNALGPADADGAVGAIAAEPAESASRRRSGLRSRTRACSARATSAAARSGSSRSSTRRRRPGSRRTIDKQNRPHAEAAT